MKLARHLERRLERLVDGMAARIFRGRVRPVEIATRLVREADLGVTQGSAGPSIPNVFEVSVNPADVAADGELAAANRELAAVVAEAAAERGWRLEGPVQVRLHADAAVPRGDLRCRTSVAPGPLEPWAALEGRDGDPLAIGPLRSVVGRSAAADVRVDHPQVSRRHALLWQEAGRVLLADMGSANGTLLNGNPAGAGAEVRDGDALAFGPVTLTFRAAR